MLDQAIGAMPEDVLTSYMDEVREILNLDPADHGGFRARYLDQEARVKLNEADQLAKQQGLEWRPPRLNEDFDELHPRETSPQKDSTCGVWQCQPQSVRAGRRRLRELPHRPQAPPVFRYENAMLLLATGRLEEYRLAVRRLSTCSAETQNIPLIMPVLQASRLAEDGVADYDPLIEIAEKLVGNNQDKFPFVRTHGHLLYRGRRYREAIERLEEGLRLAAGKLTHS